MPTFREDPKIGSKVPLIKTADLNDKSVTEKKLADGSITNDKIAIGAVTSEKLQHNAVITETISDGAVTAEKIAEGAVSVDEIKDLAVVESKINNKAVTNVKIDDAAVDTRTIEDKSVTNAKIADESITQEKIFNSSVTTEKIANESVSAEKLQSGLRSTIVSTHDKAIELDKKKANVTDVDYALECLENKIGDRVVVEGNVTNLPDDEDLTSISTIDGREVMKLNDRAYEPSNFSGKGYKILRKNIQRLNLPTVTILVSNIPSFSGDITITVNGKATTVSLDVATDTTTTFIATKIGTALKSSLDDYDVSVSSNTIVLTRNNSKYASPSSIDVGNTTAGFTVKDSITKSERKNVLTQDMINEPNTVYEIRYDFDLNGEEVSIKEGCVLKFNGGSFKNGILNGNSVYINNKENTLIFKDIKIKNCVSNIVSSDWFFTYRNGYQYTSIDKTSYTVNGVQYSFKTAPSLSYNDDTWNLQQLLNIDANTYIIEEGIYMINPDRNDSEGIDDNRFGGLKFKGKNNKKIQIKGTLKAIPSEVGDGVLLRIQECSNIVLCGNGIFQGDLGEVLKEGEFGSTGIYVNSSSYITIKDLSFEYFAIDGVYISWRRYYSNTDSNVQHHHVIDNITCKGNRRTGLVYEIGDYVVIKNSTFIDNGTIRGTATYSGIDIEPFGDSSVKKRYCRNFVFKNNKFITNAGTGLRTERCLDAIICGNYFYKNSVNIELHRSFYSTEDITDSSDRRYVSGKSYVYNNFFDGGKTISASYSEGCVDFYNNFCINQVLILSGTWRYSNFYNNLIINCVSFGYLQAKDTNIYSNRIDGITMSSDPVHSNDNSPIFIRITEGENVEIYNNKVYYCRGKVIEGAGENGKSPISLYQFKKYPYMIAKDYINSVYIHDNYIDHRYFLDVVKTNYYGDICINNTIEENNLFICYVGDTIVSNKYKQKGIVTKSARVRVDDECVEFSPNLEVSENTKVCNSEKTKMFVATTAGTLGDIFPLGWSSGTCKTHPLSLSSPDIVWCNVGSCTSTTRPNFINSIGRRLLETDTNLLIEYNGKTWVVISNNYKGSTDERPVLNNNDLGVEYYDTTLKKKILWNGTEWTNMDGTTLS